MAALDAPSSFERNDGLAPSLSPEVVVALLLDPHSRRIVMSTIERGKTVEEIQAETGIPLSTCYRKVAGLLGSHVLFVERSILTASGKKYALYRSAIASIRIEMRLGDLSVSVSPNPEVAEKLRLEWLSGRPTRP